ncbi:hypothetical protein [Haladaptatus caseinilyticus]|uniref:hypothetical protein n=1 Tax=Haladaptatus caseinilyticus TaxID=2993314 RepID=UPI00224B4780|nr:hypothetical protein [Haladaptatus caseinilyticus]
MALYLGDGNNRVRWQAIRRSGWKRDLGTRVRQGLAGANRTPFAITGPTDTPKMLYVLEGP